MSNPIFTTLFGVSIWTGAQGLLILVNNPVLAFVCHLEIYVGAIIGTTGVAHVALVQANQTAWLQPRRLGILYGSIGVWCLLLLTNPAHEWLYVFRSYAGELVPVLQNINRLYWLYLVQNWLLATVGLGILVNEYRQAHSGSIYRKQAGTMAVAVLIPLTTNILAHSGATTNNYSVWGFGATGLLTAAALYRYRWMDLVPVGRDTVIKQMQGGYLVVDAEFRVIDLNETALSLFSGTNLIGSDLETVCPAFLPLLTGDQTEQQLQFEGTVLTATKSPIETPRGTGHLVMFRDITEQQRAERRFQALTENIPDNILIVDEAGQIKYTNRSLNDTNLIGPDTTATQNLFKFIHPDDYVHAAHTFARLARTPGRKDRYEFRTLQDNGTVRVFDGIGINMLDDPLVDGIVIVFRNVTQQKAREQQLQATKDNLEASNQKLEQFAGVVSHDLRNPLNVAKGNLDLAQEFGDEEYFETVGDSLDRMNAIIDDVLTLARQGESVGDTERVTLATAATDAWSYVETDDAELVIAEDATLQSDRARLLQLFENLLRNAHEHVGDDVTVTVGATDDVFYVEDDGPGIPHGKRDQILESGYTTNDAGTGFGLSIVSQVADAHGWEVEVTEGTDGGARFEFHGANPITAT